MRRGIRDGDRFAMLVIVVGRARAFGRNHQRADRLFGRAFASEKFALRGLEHAFQDFAALRGFGVGHADAGNSEALLGVPLAYVSRIFRADCEMNPRPRHSKYGRSSNTSAMARSAARFPSQGTTRLY